MSVLPDTYIIQLDNMHFCAPVGVGAEERKVGSKIIVEMTAEAEVSSKAFMDDDFSEAPDYSVIYQEIAKVVKEPVCLLEHLAYKIARTVLDVISGFVCVEVSVTKINPPLSGDGVNASVKFRLNR